jgi:hypothetical protein
VQQSIRENLRNAEDQLVEGGLHLSAATDKIQLRAPSSIVLIRPDCSSFKQVIHTSLL